MYDNPNYRQIRKTISNSLTLDLITRAFASHDYQNQLPESNCTVKDLFFDSYDESAVAAEAALVLTKILELEDQALTSQRIQEVNSRLVMKVITGDISNFERSLNRILNVDLRSERAGESQIGASIGLIAAFPSYYYREQEKENLEEFIGGIRHLSKPVGVLKKRINIKLKMVSFNDFRHRSYSTVQAVHDDSNLVYFFLSNESSQYGKSKLIDQFRKMKFGEEFTVRASPAQHDIGKYNHCMETKLNRVVLV